MVAQYSPESKGFWLGYEAKSDLPRAILRISLGVMFIAHSVVLKHFTFTLPGTSGYFESIGLPGFLAYVVFGMEAVSGWEYPLYLIVLSAAQVLLVEGSFALDRQFTKYWLSATPQTHG